MVGELSPDLRAELERAAALGSHCIDTSDAPEVTDWSGAFRGRFYRPVKRQVTLRVDADILAYFRSTERHYQTAINRTLRAAMLRGMRRRQRAAPQ